jgi:hypothetical protein
VSTQAAGTARLDTIAERLVVLGLVGNDTIGATGDLAALTLLTLDGGPDDDTINGGNGPDLLLGGGGNDFVDGNQGADRAELGGGEDSFRWDPGDGSDVVEGGVGDDLLDFFGSGGDEVFVASANGSRARFTRNLGNIVMDLDDVEAVAVRALGGLDQLTVEDLRGTDLRSVLADLNGPGGGGDGAIDTVIVNGTAGADAVQVTRAGAQVNVEGLFARTQIVGSEPTDVLRVQTLAGNDTVTVAPDVSSLITPVVDLGTDE